MLDLNPNELRLDGGNPTIINAAEATWEKQTGTIRRWNGSGERFNNAGTFRKTTDAGATVGNGVAFNNTGGTIDAQGGAIQFNAVGAWDDAAFTPVKTGYTCPPAAPISGLTAIRGLREQSRFQPAP